MHLCEAEVRFHYQQFDVGLAIEPCIQNTFVCAQILNCILNSFATEQCEITHEGEPNCGAAELALLTGWDLFAVVECSGILRTESLRPGINRSAPANEQAPYH